ncbi:MAG: hypothetical protein EBZ67_10655 [Chitinophagia bacterium]|nr:hypothetical protein [Chitinophagia bacterium]
MNTNGKGAHRNLRYGLLVSASSLVLSLLLAELILRILGIGYGSTPVEPDSRLHHVHPRNYSFIMHNPSGEYGGIRIRYDEQGCRISGDREPRALANPQARVAFLGDSFTEANQVDWDSSFVGMLEARNPSVLVRNYGVSSYSPLIYRLKLDEILRDFRPTHIVLQIFANDYINDWEYLDKANDTDYTRVTAVNGGSRSLAITLLRYSYLARLTRKVQKQFEYRRATHPPPSDYGYDILHLTPEEYPFRKMAYGNLTLLQKNLEARGVPLYIMMIPNKTHAYENRCCSEDSLHEEVRRFAEERHINFIDLGQAFQAVADQQSLFFRNDIHLTPRGHVIVAGAIARVIGLN